MALVIPVYNESEVLPELLRRLTALFDGCPQFEWSAILIDDGSRDDSAAQVQGWCERDRRFRLLGLSRNFGFQAALMAGLAHAVEFDAVVTLDADLQDPPEVIPLLVERWRAGAKVVLAVRQSRQERGLRRVGMDLFHLIFRRLVDIDIERNTGTFGLLDREAVTAFNQLPEAHRFFPGLRSWLGFARAEVSYDRQKRAAGKPGQDFIRLCRYAFDGLFSFSRLPLRFLLISGLVIASFGFAMGAFYVVRRLIGIEVAQMGFTTLVTLLLFLGGIQLIGIGVLGEYLGRIYDEVKRRPNYLVGRRVGFDPSSGPEIRSRSPAPGHE